MNFINIAQILAAVNSGTYQEQCENEAMAALTCVMTNEPNCLPCVVETVADFDESTTCDDLKVTA